MMYDLIGDIHGHADELIQLLKLLGYSKRSGVFRHSERKLIFLGDFIDRGSQIREVLDIVRPTIEAGYALAVMGNHELNALAYHTEDEESPGEYLRRHTSGNIHQHAKTLEQLTSGELASHLEWFRTLPMWLDLEGIRVVHACWDERSMATIAQALDGRTGITNEILRLGCRPGKELFAPVEIVLKGKEATLPTGVTFQDRYGQVRKQARIRWYLPPERHTYRSYVLSDEIDCDLEIDASIVAEATPYSADAKPVFVGHYWLSAKRPEILAENVACLDFSVAKGGFLCAYRWQGERKLSNDNFAWIDQFTGCRHREESAEALRQNH